MNKKRVVILFSVVAFVSVALAFEGKTQLTRKTLGLVKSKKSESTSSTKQITAPSPPPRQKRELMPASQKAEVPEYILYDQMFRLIVKFKKKAEEQKAKGEPVTPLRDYFQKEAKLNDEQTRILQETAERFVAEVELIDAEARVIIENIRASVPRGQPSIDKKLLEPPAELKQLQKKREELALRYRDQLRDSFGAEQFGQFQNFVEQNMKQVITGVYIDGSKLVPTTDEITPSLRYPLNEGGLKK
jgi:hypothetical protein